MSLKKRIKDLNKQLRKDRANLPLRVQLAALYREQGQSKEAIEVFLGVALDYYKGRHLEQARNICHTLLEMSPEHKEARDLLKVVELGLRAGRASSEVDDHAARGEWVPSLAKQNDKRAGSSADGEARAREAAGSATADDDKTAEKPALAGKAPAKRRAERQLEPAARADVPTDQDVPVPRGPDDSPSLVYTPTPLPAPLAPHDADSDDSIPDGSLERYKLPIDPDPSGPMPAVSLPAHLAAVHDDLLNDDSLGAPVEDVPTRLAPNPKDRLRPQPRRSDTFSDDETTQLTAITESDQPSLDDDDIDARLDYAAPYPADDGTVQAVHADDAAATIRIAIPERSPFLGEALIGSNPFIDLPERPDGLPVVIHDDLELSDRLTDHFGDALDDLFIGDPGAPQPSPSESRAPLEVFSGLPAEAFKELAARMTMRHYAADQYILRQEERARACFAIAAGQVSVLRYDPTDPDGDYQELCRLSDGQVFGESCLLPVRYSRGSVRALSECDVYEIPRRLLRELAAIHPGVDEALASIYRARLLDSLLATHPFLRGMKQHQRQELRARFRVEHHASGAPLIEEGAAPGGLYLVVVGAAEVCKRLSRNRSTLLATVEEGSYLTDMSILAGSTARATVRAAGPLELAVLSPEDTRAVIEATPELWDAICAERGRGALERNYLLTGPGIMI